MDVPNATAGAALAYLADGPQSAWDVAHGLQELVGDFWNVTASQVYRELSRMTDDGLVRRGEPGPRDRREYTITPEGRRALRRWLRQPPEADQVRIPLLLKLFLGASLPDKVLRPFLAEHRRHHEELVARYEQTHADLEAGGLPQAHVVRYGLFHSRAVLAWLDTLPWAD